MTWMNRDGRLQILVSTAAATAFSFMMNRFLIGWLPVPHLTDEATRGFNYSHAVLVPNYFEDGFIRRGLAGTVLAIVDGRHILLSGVTFHILSTIWLAIPLAVLLVWAARVNMRTTVWLAVVLVLSPQFRGWGHDTARTDMFAASFVAWSTVAALHRRWTVAAIVLGVGSLAHESVVIMGAPLLLTLWYIDYRETGIAVRSIVVAFMMLALFLAAAALLQHMLGASDAVIAASIMRDSPPDVFRDVAVYMTVGGARTLTASACISHASPGFPLFVTSGFAVLLLYVPLLGYRTRLHWLAFAVIALTPMLFLSIVAIDYGRWLMFATFNAWLGAVALVRREQDDFVGVRVKLWIGVPILALLICAGTTGIFSANALTEHVAEKLWHHARVSPIEAIDRCDPQWRDIASGNLGTTARNSASSQRPSDRDSGDAAVAPPSGGTD